MAGGNTLFRQGLKTLLGVRPDIEVVGEAADDWEAVMGARTLEPDIVIIEISMPLTTSLDHLSRIKEDVPNTRVLVLTNSEREEDLWQALRRGVHGYMLTNCDSAQLFQAIESIMRGELAVSPLLGGRALRGLALRGEKALGVPDQLTPREREVLELLGRGISDRDISQQLSLSVSTVGHHVHNILRKLRLKNRVQAATLSRTESRYHKLHLEEEA